MCSHKLLDLADKAARCALRGRGTLEDWEDATQEAAAAIWQVWGEPEGVAFLAGKHAIYDWLRSWLRHPRGGTILDYRGYQQESNTVRDLAWLETVSAILQTQGATKADEDTRYLRLRLLGYSTSGIALEMGISERRVYAIRERTLPRLERAAAGIVPLSRGEAISRGRRHASTQ